jgi:hypothetical protein
METQTKYTVFCEDGYWPAGEGDVPGDLSGAIEYAVNEEDGYPPIAWAAEPVNNYGGTKHWAVLRAESIAAGRTIEMVDGKYVPRGVPVEDKPTVASPGDQLIYDAMAAAYLSAKGFAEIQAKSAATPQPTKERTRPALTWADPAPDFDPWKGFFTEPADMADWQDTYYPR